MNISLINLLNKMHVQQCSSLYLRKYISEEPKCCLFQSLFTWGTSYRFWIQFQNWKCTQGPTQISRAIDAWLNECRYVTLIGIPHLSPYSLQENSLILTRVVHDLFPPNSFLHLIHLWSHFPKSYGKHIWVRSLQLGLSLQQNREPLVLSCVQVTQLVQCED
jgi:hypothetical protein